MLLLLLLFCLCASYFVQFLACIARQVERVIFGRSFSFRQCLLHDDIDGAAIFGVHANQAAVLGRCCRALKWSVVDMNTPGYGSERLELVRLRAPTVISESCPPETSVTMQWKA